MNWTETRARLIECGISAARLPEEWQPGIDLRAADLTWADLPWANLTEADLTEANLTWADLTEANLTGADLTGADLTGANLTRANLTGAHLAGIVVAWQSHDLLADILRRAAGDSVPRRMLAGLIAISTDWCWGEFLNLDIDPALREWAIAELRQWVRDSDAAPDALRATSPAA